jgi:DNA replication and repair protein RecF
MARRDGPGGFAVAARLDEIESAPAPPGGSDRRQVRINGAGGANSLSEWLSVLWLTPAMDRLFIEAASGRRRFLDRLVLALNPGHAMHATRYDAAMRARNKLLAEEGLPDEAWLAALEARMVEHGAAIGSARSATVAALAGRLEAAPRAVRPRQSLRCRAATSRPGAQSGIGPARDSSAGRTLAGPHRTDLLVTHLEKSQPASLCSTGEQKALLINIVLAHADLVGDRAGRRPILLLDEIAAHLDPVRRAALFGRLASGGGQVWMTGTERASFSAIGEATWLAISDGVAIPV